MQPNLEHFHWTHPSGERMEPSSARPLELVSRSLAMRRIADQLQKLGDSRFILIEGEAGTGKQTLARRIHAIGTHTTPQNSTGNVNDRQRRAAIDAATSCVVEDAAEVFRAGDMLSDELENYAIAPAATKAAHGVLVIRGIDELETAAQSRLLRFVRSFENDADLTGPTPARIICTSRQPLRTKVLNARFLPELYYRLSAACFSLPPLRERKEDIPGLAQMFIDTFSRDRRRPLQGLGQGALAILLRHRWPGNVRELESVIRAACFSTDGQWIRPLDLVILPLETVPTGTPEPAPPQDLTLDGVIRRHVRSVLKLCAGNKARAASRLGISRSTLYRMLDSNPENGFDSDFHGGRDTVDGQSRNSAPLGELQMNDEAG